MNIIEIIIVILCISPILFIFGFILALMAHTNKTNIRKSKSDIWGYVFVVLYAIVFIGSILVSGYNKTWSLIGFGIILFSLLGLLLFAAIASASNKTIGPEVIRTTGRVIGQTIKKPKHNADGYLIEQFTIRFTYTHNNETKECETLETFSPSQIKYLQSLNSEVKLDVCNSYCRVISRVNHIKEDLRTTAPHPNKKLTTKSFYNVDFLAAIFGTAPILGGTIFMAYSAWETARPFSILVIIMGVAPVALAVLSTYNGYKGKMKIDKKGTHTTTRDYTITQLSNTRYIVEYSYLDNYGNTRYDKERLDADIYFAIKSINGPLPIIVYNNDSIVDINLINELKNNR